MIYCVSNDFGTLVWFWAEFIVSVVPVFTHGTA